MPRSSRGLLVSLQFIHIHLVSGLENKRHLLILLFHQLSGRMEMLGAVSPSVHMCAARPGLIK